MPNRPAKEAGVTNAGERAAQSILELRRKALAASGDPTAAPTAPVKAARTTKAAAKAGEPNAATVQRRRQTEETRAQLLERLNNPLLSLQEVSILLRVCPATVRRYANAGILPCVRTPGRQRRFPWRDIQAFMRANEGRKQ